MFPGAHDTPSRAAGGVFRAGNFHGQAIADVIMQLQQAFTGCSRKTLKLSDFVQFVPGLKTRQPHSVDVSEAGLSMVDA